jgi:hypothetical protein
MKFILIVVLIVGIGTAVAVSQKQTSTLKPTTETAIAQTTPAPSPTNFTAQFSIVTNGTTRIFTDPKYHNRSTDVFLTASNPNEIYVTKSHITWQDFFNTLPMKLTKDCLTTGTGQVFCSNNNGTLKFYLNNQEDSEALSKVIHPSDSLRVEYR